VFWKTLRFKVTPNTNEVTPNDEAYIKEIIQDNLGKWESLIKTGLYVFSEIGIIHPETAILERYEKPFGIELYSEPSVERDGLNDWLWVFITLTQNERIKRRNANINPIIQVEEIWNQLINIPKWKAFEKTIKIVKGQWSTQ
jgi:hypothetical protein